MFRLSPSFKWAVISLAVMAVCAQPQRGAAQSTSAILAALGQTIETKEFRRERIQFKEVLEKLSEKLTVNGKKVPIIVDVGSFMNENPDMPDIYETLVEFPSLPNMKASELLRWTIDRIPTKNANFVVRHDHILISTNDRTSAAAKLHEKVRGVFQNRVLTSVLQELSESTGATIIIDNRATDKAKTEITATFLNDIPLAGALRVLTEMADLKVVVLDGTILVTTAAHANLLRKEEQEKEYGPEALRAAAAQALINAKIPLDFGTLPWLPGFPGVPGTGIGSDPLWPYNPNFLPWRPGIGK